MTLSSHLAVQITGLIALHVLLVTRANAQAQSTRANSIDSLIARENLQSTTQSYYLRPLLEVQQGSSKVQGDERFSEPNANLMRRISLGIRLGYRSGPFEIETGLSSIRIGAGYQFTPEYAPGLNSRIRSTDYTQVPLVARYRFWELNQRLSFRAGVGVAYSFDLNKFQLAPSSVQEEYAYSGDGNRTLAARVSSNYNRKRNFWSGEINLSAYYQVSRRFSVVIEGKRLVSSISIVTLDNVREALNPVAIQRFNATGGANGYNFNLGVSYQFGFKNRYHISDE